MVTIRQADIGAKAFTILTQVDIAFVDAQQAKSVIISSQLNEELEKRLPDVLRGNEQEINQT